MADSMTTADSLPGTVPAPASPRDTAVLTPRSAHSNPAAVYPVPGAAEDYDDELGEVIEDDAIFSADGTGQGPNVIRPRLRRRSSEAPPQAAAAATAAAQASAGTTLRISTLQTHDEAYASGQQQSFVYSPHAEGVSALRGRSPTSANAPQAFPVPMTTSVVVSGAFESSAQLRPGLLTSGGSGSFQYGRRSVSFRAADEQFEVEDDETAIIDDEVEQDEEAQQRRRELLRASSFRSADSDRESDASSATSFRAVERYRLRQEDHAARSHMAELQRALGGGRVAAGSFAVPGGFVLRQSAPVHLIAPLHSTRGSHPTSPLAASSSIGAAGHSTNSAPSSLPASMYVTPPTPQVSYARPPAVVDTLDGDGPTTPPEAGSSNDRGGADADDSSSDAGRRRHNDATSSSSPDVVVSEVPISTQYNNKAKQPPRTQLSDVPTEILRFAVDHFLSISQHFNLRLVCRRWNAMVVSNCVLWMRRVPNYLTHGYTSTTNCSVFINAGISVTATFNRVASRSSFGNLTLASSTLSEDTAVLTRQQSWSSEANAARFARPQSIHYCFNGCAYRTWRALRLQKALSAIRRFHKQKNKYYGGAAACGVLFPPSAGFGTLINAVIMCCVFIGWSIMWSDVVPTMQDPNYIAYTFIALWVAIFFFMCVLYMWSSSVEVVRRVGLVAFTLGVCATGVMEFLLDAYALPSGTNLLLRVDPGTSYVTTSAPVNGTSTPSPASLTSSPSASISGTYPATAAAKYAVSVILDLTAQQGTTIAAKNLRDVPSQQLLYVLPLLLGAVGLAAVSAYFAYVDTEITSRALELFEILDRYCSGVVPVRRLQRRFREGIPLMTASQGPMDGIQPPQHAVIMMEQLQPAQQQQPPAQQPQQQQQQQQPPTPTRGNRRRGAPRNPPAGGEAPADDDAAQPADDGDSDDGNEGPTRGGSMGNADGATAVSAGTTDTARAAAEHQKSYSVAMFAAFNYSYTATGVVFCVALLFFALELAGVSGYYAHYNVVFADVGGLVANGHVSGNGALYTTIPDPLKNQSTCIVTLLGQSAASSPTLSRLSCTAHSGFRFSFFLVAIGMGMLLVRHVIGMTSSWRKVGRRLPPFTTTMVLIGLGMIATGITSLGFAFSRVNRADTKLSDSERVSRFLFATTFPTSTSSSSQTNAPSTSDPAAVVPTTFDPSQIRISCREPSVFTLPELVLVVFAVFTIMCAIVANLAHDKGRYYEFKMVKYRRYFERLCAGEDLTTLGIDRLIAAIRRFNDSIGATPGPGPMVTAASTTAATSNTSMLRGNSNTTATNNNNAV